MFYSEQLRRYREIVVPQIVMDGLEVPQALARARIQRQQRIAKQVVPFAVASVEIVARGPQREICDAPFLVGRQLAPVVHAAGGLPAFWRSSVVTKFSRARNHVEWPNQFAGE